MRRLGYLSVRRLQEQRVCRKQNIQLIYFAAQFAIVSVSLWLSIHNKKFDLSTFITPLKIELHKGCDPPTIKIQIPEHCCGFWLDSKKRGNIGSARSQFVTNFQIISWLSLNRILDLLFSISIVKFSFYDITFLGEQFVMYTVACQYKTVPHNELSRLLCFHCRHKKSYCVQRTSCIVRLFTCFDWVHAYLLFMCVMFRSGSELLSQHDGSGLEARWKLLHIWRTMRRHVQCVIFRFLQTEIKCLSQLLSKTWRFSDSRLYIINFRLACSRFLHSFKFVSLTITAIIAPF